MSRGKPGLMLVLGLGLVALTANVVTLAPSVREKLEFTSTHRHNTVDTRLQWQWGELHRLTALIRDKTPPQSTILIPQRWPDMDAVWFDVGNVHIVRAFVYPRQITVVPRDGSENHLFRPSQPNVFAVVVSRKVGGRSYTWPPRDAIPGWRVISLPAPWAWGLAASPATSAR